MDVEGVQLVLAFDVVTRAEDGGGYRSTTAGIGSISATGETIAEAKARFGAALQAAVNEGLKWRLARAWRPMSSPPPVGVHWISVKGFPVELAQRSGLGYWYQMGSEETMFEDGMVTHWMPTEPAPAPPAGEGA